MKNTVWIGLALGLVSPLLAYLLTNYTGLVEQFFPSKPMLLYVVAGAVNLLLVRQFYRKTVAKENIGKGILLVTFLGMLLFLYFYKLNM